ncbi:MAG TPA: hypothetical protein VKA37_10560 [Halobacteriales archaeon]|nr:hypothetical protein [Halobacteriales archaeon]
MNLERLRAVQAEEREADSLRALPDSFYRKVAEYIEELRGERASAAEAAADPFDSEDVQRLTEEIEHAESLAEAIYERRVGKLVKQASLAAAGVPADEAGLTTEEAELFSDLVDQIEAHRDEVLATFDGERDAELGPVESSAGSSEPAPGDTETESPSGGDESSEVLASGTDPSSVAGSESDSSDDAPPPPPDEPVSDDDPGLTDAATGDADGGHDEPTEGADTDRLTLRITADVGEVFGVDERVYDLAEEDVVSLPAANAKPLLERDAAERVE